MAQTPTRPTFHAYIAESYGLTARFAISRALDGPYPEGNTSEAYIYARAAFHAAAKVLEEPGVQFFGVAGGKAVR